MGALQELASHAGLIIFTALTAIIIVYLLYALVHPERL
jgi:hypothetical protein